MVMGLGRGFETPQGRRTNCEWQGLKIDYLCVLYGPRAKGGCKVSQTEKEWIASLATALSVDVPTDEEREALLALAASAAHVSERTAAPISCWLVARAGLSAAQGKALAERLAKEVQG